MNRRNWDARSMRPLSEAAIRILQHAAGRPDGNPCPTFGIRGASQTAILESLERRGMLQRPPEDPRGVRARPYSITDAGRSFLAASGHAPILDRFAARQSDSTPQAEAAAPLYRFPLFRHLDRVDARGDIREHATHSRLQGAAYPAPYYMTLCGLPLHWSQAQRPAGNRTCKRCAELEQAAANVLARFAEAAIPTPLAP